MPEADVPAAPADNLLATGTKPSAPNAREDHRDGESAAVKGDHEADVNSEPSVSLGDGDGSATPSRTAEQDASFEAVSEGAEPPTTASEPAATPTTAEASAGAASQEESAAEGSSTQPRPVRRLPPPPKKGILRPPSSSHAASSRFSFRRDILQPFGTSYTRATAAEGSSTAGAAVGSVGEAVGNAAATAGGFFGSALKRLTAAAAGTDESSAAAHAPSPGLAAQTGASTKAVPLASAAAPAVPASTTSPSAPAQVQTPAAIPASSTPQVPLPVTGLKRVRFRMAALKLVYPINGGTLDAIAPADEGATRERVESEWRLRHLGSGPAAASGGEVRDSQGGRRSKVGEDHKEGVPKEGKLWTGEELGRLYAECCRTREEPGIERVKRAFRENPGVPSKVLDLSNELLSRGAVEALSDLLAIDFGLKKLTLDRCGLDDESLRPLLHALLVSACIPTVSLAGNKRIRARGWKFIATFLRKATFLRYIDLSETPLDRRAAEFLVQALAPAPPPPAEPPVAPDKPDALPLRDSKDDVQLGESRKKKVAGPWDDDEDESDLEEASTAANGKEAVQNADGTARPETEEAPGMERADANTEDASAAAGAGHEDDPSAPLREPLFDTAPLLKEDTSCNPAAVLSVRLENCGVRGQVLEVLAPGVRVSEVKHISLRKNRINAAGAVALAVLIRDYPLSSDPSSTYALASTLPFGSSANANGGTETKDEPQPPAYPSFEAANSVSARQRDRAGSAPTEALTEDRSTIQHASPLGEREAWRLSEARLRLKKQLDGLPRIGSLLTLDVKGNDIRSGVTYIAQVLKRNRTLKVLNLGENKIDPQGLVALAEALKFNTTLETLDMGHNPCCGPQLDGILALRSAMMVSRSLKRVFLNSTELSSEGAIALAEFLPEAHSLLHLDLTNNHVDISGVLALSVSIKLNSTIRCLDINIPFDDPDFSRLSQDLLETCVRNTELAQQKADSEARDAAAKRVVVAQPIRKSALASNLEARQHAEELRAKRRAAAARAQQGDDIFAAAAETRDVVSQLLAVEQAAGAREPSEVVRDALVQLQLAEAQLAEAFSGARQAEQRERAEVLLTELASLLDLAKAMFSRPHGNPDAAAPASAASSDTLSAARDGSSPPLSPHASEEEAEDRKGKDNVVRSSNGEASPADSLAPSLKPAALQLPEDLSPSASSGSSSPTVTVRSPIESESRAMVAEEGEMFRKGVALGVDEVPDESDEEGAAEVSGEQLKKELLETTVQRSPRPSFDANETPRPVLADTLARPPSDSLE